jgi:mannose-1-phosphate guanylyltransferase
MVRKAVVLAAGKSTRIASWSGGLPKPLLEIGGEPIIRRNLRWLARGGIDQVWINLHYRPELIRQRVGDGRELGLKVQYSYEPEILGTAGGVRQIAAGWSEPFVVLYGDSLFRSDLRLMELAHYRSRAAMTIGLFDRWLHPHTGLAGGAVTLAPDGRVAGFVEGAMDSPLVNAGCYLMESAVVGRIPAAGFCDFGRDLFPRLLACGIPVNAHLIEGYCLGVDTPQAYQRALNLIAQGRVELT